MNYHDDLHWVRPFVHASKVDFCFYWRAFDVGSVVLNIVKIGHFWLMLSCAVIEFEAATVIVKSTSYFQLIQFKSKPMGYLKPSDEFS